MRRLIASAEHFSFDIAQRAVRDITTFGALSRGRKRRKVRLGLTARWFDPSNAQMHDVERETYAEALADPRLHQRSSRRS
jgi:hypothetical protein